MANYKILTSNLGYLRGINGQLVSHLVFAHRHIYCAPSVQKKSILQLAKLIETEDPDICCFMEIDQGSHDCGYFNQLEALLLNENYRYFHIENKYAPNSRLRQFAFTRGKSNAFISKKEYPHESIYFTHGTKRLVYKLQLKKNLTLFFAHFSLKKSVRARQLAEIRELIKTTSGETILLGDFNILTGLQELAPLLNQNNLKLLNKEDLPTFTFHRSQKVLDLCICSESLAPRMHLRVIPQPFSDHAALLAEIEGH